MTEMVPASIPAQFLHNRVLLTAFLGWAFAQTLKVILGVFREKRFNFRWFVGAGGMPSSHAASVAALSTAIGLQYGFQSPFFAAAGLFSFIIMFDAQGVRRQSGRQAETLNNIVEDLYRQKGIREERLKELFGHTPIEVFAGALIGVLVALAMYV